MEEFVPKRTEEVVARFLGLLKYVDGDYSQRSTFDALRKTLGELNSEELKRLETAAAPLIATLREDQKEEVRTLTRLMGLEHLASQFSK